MIIEYKLDITSQIKLPNFGVWIYSNRAYLKDVIRNVKIRFF